jgi:glutamyl-tRNA reductase
MRVAITVLACLACISNGRRVRSLREQEEDSSSLKPSGGAAESSLAEVNQTFFPRSGFSVPGSRSAKTQRLAKRSRSSTAAMQQLRQVQQPSVDAASLVQGLVSPPSAAAINQGIPPDVQVMCIGMDIHDSNVSVRERVAIPKDDWVTAAKELMESSNGDIVNAAVLSTCNRFELYVTSETNRVAQGEHAVMRWLKKRSGLEESDLRDNLFVMQAEEAVNHVLRVSAGLESLVIGEAQILAQVNACHQAAVDGGQGGRVLNSLLGQAVIFGKYVRTKTRISKGGVSISSAAVQFAEERLPKDLDKSLQDATIAVVGAGRMARLIFIHLRELGCKEVVLCSRSIGENSSAGALQIEFQEDMKVTLRPLTEMYDVIAEHDLTFLATAASEPIVTRGDLSKKLEGSDRTSPVALVDVCVPRNVAPEVDDLSNVVSYDIDALKAVVTRNTEARKVEMMKAEWMLKEEKKEWLAWHESLYPTIPTIKRLVEQAEMVRQRELMKFEKEMSHLNYDEKDSVEEYTKALVKRLIGKPIMVLRQNATKAAKYRTIGEFNSLFDLYEGNEIRDDAVGLLEYLADNVKSEVGTAAKVTEALMPPETGERNFATHPADTKRALARERVAELNVIEKLSCGILEATKSTLDYIDQRADAIRGKVMTTKYRVEAKEALEGAGCTDPRYSFQEKMPEPYDIVTEGVQNQRKAEVKALNTISLNLARTAMDAVTKLRGRAENIKQRELRNRKKYGSILKTDAELMDTIGNSIVNALLAGPASHLTAAQAVDEKSRTLESFADIFGMSIENLDSDAIDINVGPTEDKKLVVA